MPWALAMEESKELHKSSAELLDSLVLDISESSTLPSAWDIVKTLLVFTSEEEKTLRGILKKLIEIALHLSMEKAGHLPGAIQPLLGLCHLLVQKEYYGIAMCEEGSMGVAIDIVSLSSMRKPLRNALA